MSRRLAIPCMTAMAMASIPGFAQSPAPNGVKTLDPPGAIKAEGTWSLGTRAGDFIFVAGMQGVDPATNTLVQDPQARIRQAFLNIRLIAQSEGASLQDCVETVLDEGIPGDLVECGVWRGGACVLMRAVLAAYGNKTRRVWLADSFAGVPPPDTANFAVDKWSLLHHFAPVLAVSEAEVRANFARYCLLDDQVRFLPGWFKDTLHDAPIERIAVLRLDGDLYESTIQALDGLYPRLSPGGFCIIDDYNLKACRQAVGDYRATHGITAEIVDIDGSGAFWRNH